MLLRHATRRHELNHNKHDTGFMEVLQGAVFFGANVLLFGVNASREKADINSRDDVVGVQQCLT